MNEILISVIIPVYKVERFLRDCIESVLAQTYSNLQIILIDDGSPDNSGKICDEYAQQDARVEVIHQENLGVSVARNKGIARAKGELIAFVDSDDVLPSKAYELLLNEYRDGHLVMGRMQLMNESGILQIKSKKPEVKQINQEEFLLDLFEETRFSYLGYPTDKLYKKEVIIENQIWFDPCVKLNEDRLFIMQYMFFCETVDFCDEIVYHYRQRDEGIITEIRRSRIITDSEMTVIDAFEKMQKIGKNYSDDLYYLVCRKSFESALDLLNRVDKKDKEKKKILMRFLWHNSNICMRNPNYRFMDKIKIAGHVLLKK